MTRCLTGYLGAIRGNAFPRKADSGGPDCSVGARRAGARIKRGRRQLALARMRQALDAGQAVAIFPQGAVCGDRVWHRGAARLALVTGAPLVPVRLVGTARALSRGRIGFPQLRIIFGEPIKVARAQEESVAATKLTERLRAAVESLA